MNIDFEKLPTSVFDWIENNDFEELEFNQKREVLDHFSVEEYNELRQAFLSLGKVSALPLSRTNVSGKTHLLNHFDKQFVTAKGNHGSRSYLFLQAAAVFLLMLSGWLFYYVFDLKKDVVIKEVASIDTVYVDREISASPEVIHDTVYKYEVIKGKDSDSNRESGFKREDETVNEMDDSALPELENASPVSKGQSMKDDSLLRKFGFVAM